MATQREEIDYLYAMLGVTPLEEVQKLKKGKHPFGLAE